MVSAFVSYVGYFTKVYRQNLILNEWMPYFKEIKVLPKSLLFVKKKINTNIDFYIFFYLKI